MKKRKVVAGISVCLSAVLLSGCSMSDWMTGFPFLVNEKTVLERSAKAMQELESVSAAFTMDYGVSVEVPLDDSGATTSFPIQLSMKDVQVALQMPDGTLSDGFVDGTIDVVMSLFGQEINQEVPVGMYLESGEDGYTMYSSSDGASWTKESISKDEFADSEAASLFQSADGQALSSVNADMWTLVKDKVEIGGVKTYELTAEVPGDVLQEAVEPLLGDAMSEYGMTDVAFPDMILMQNVDVDTYHVIAIQMDMADDSGFEMETDSGTLTFETMSMRVLYDDFNAVEDEAVAVPDEVKDVVISTDAGLDSDDILEGSLEGNGFNLNDNPDWDADTAETDVSGDTMTASGYTVGLTEAGAGKFGDIYVGDNYFSADTADGTYSLSVSIYEWGVNQDYVTEEQQAANSYYASASDISDVFIGDVQSTTFGSYPVYWYSEQYTDMAMDFVHNEYDFYVVLDEETTALVAVEEYSDVQQDVTLNDATALQFLDMLSITEA